MTGKKTDRRETEPDNRGFVSLEFLVGLAVIMVPLLLAWSEVYRAEHYARKMLLSAQSKCIAEAVDNRRNSYREVSVSVEEDVRMLDATRKVFGTWLNRWDVHFERTYYVLTGTGME